MNFYQRANLSMGLAVLIAFEFAVISVLNPTQNSAFTFSTSALFWLFFQFIFQLKVTLDDHYHFSAEFHSLHPHLVNRIFWDFLFFSVTSLLFILAAVTTFNKEYSFIFFSLALIVSIFWIIYHLSMDTFQKRPIDKINNFHWLFINILLLLVLFLEKSQIFVFWQYQYYLALLAILIFDTWKSDTLYYMPKIT